MHNESSMGERVNRLARMKSRDLRSLFETSQSGIIPEGNSFGTPVFLPGTLLGRFGSWLGSFIWKGKVITRFGDRSGTLINKIIGLRFGKATVSFGKSWNDGGKAIIIEYLWHSLFFFWIHDEVRCVADDHTGSVYLGRAYIRAFQLLALMLGMLGLIGLGFGWTAEWWFGWSATEWLFCGAAAAAAAALVDLKAEKFHFLGTWFILRFQKRGYRY